MDRADSSARSHSSRWLNVGVASGVLIVLLLGAYIGVSRAREAALMARLPALPDLSSQPEALRVQLTDADRTARARGASVDAVGALCLAYHADLYYEQAQQCYGVAERLKPSDWRWPYYRALTVNAGGDARAFADALRGAIVLAPEYGPAWWQLGDAEFKAGRLEEARAAWQRAVSLPEPDREPASAGRPARVTPATVAAYTMLGLARLALSKGEADRARVLLEQVTSDVPRFGPAFRLLGSAYAALNRPDDAERMVRRADRLPGYDPYIDPVYAVLVRESRSSTFLLQQAAAADVSTNGAWRERLIRRALEVDGGNRDALFELASLLRVQRRFDEALGLLQQYLRLVPGDYQALADTGRCLSGLRRYGEAEGVLLRALDGVDDANTRYDLGLVLDRLGRESEAVAEYERALARNPNHRDALNNLGVVRARQGRIRDAIRHLERLVAVDPDNPDAHTNLGTLFVAERRLQEAEHEFRQALDRDPQFEPARNALRAIGR
jgi:tetratricopeptide (TPR) repeat protein